MGIWMRFSFSLFLAGWPGNENIFTCTMRTSRIIHADHEPTECTEKKYAHLTGSRVPVRDKWYFADLVSFCCSESMIAKTPVTSKRIGIGNAFSTITIQWNYPSWISPEQIIWTTANGRSELDLVGYAVLGMDHLNNKMMRILFTAQGTVAFFAWELRLRATTGPVIDEETA